MRSKPTHRLPVYGDLYFRRIGGSSQYKRHKLTTLDDELDVRIAVFNYSTSKITQHASLLLSFLLIIFTALNIGIIPEWLRYGFLIFCLLPAIYLFGRGIFWANFNTGAIRAKPFTYIKIAEREQDNKLWRLYDAIDCWINKQSDARKIIYRFGKLFDFKLWWFKIFPIWFTFWIAFFIGYYAYELYLGI